jgi:lipopolysaccharide/colanic/teichoic acid biosynthesis glycosyltransferase
MKRTFDLLLSLFSLALLAPVFLIVALIIKLTMAGPVIFSQKRIGRQGKPFVIYKFRSMKVNKSDISITLKTDGRITPFGRFLRKSKIDELPQIWNIMKGDMSFVGFRPDVPGYHDMLSGEEKKLLFIRPGLSGADSLAYLNEEDILQHHADPQAFYDQYLFPDKVRINLAYMKKQSFMLDIKIILFTILQQKLNDPELAPRITRENQTPV